MGDQVLVDLIVKAVATGFEKLSKGFIDIEKANKDAAGALSTFGVNLSALDNPITAVAQGIKSAIDFTVQWAGDIDKLARNTGLTTEEASKLAIVAGDVGIEIGTLEASLKSMNKDGLELNFATLKKVSAQYNSTQDPVARLKIATDAFGRSAQDMTEILSRTPEELDALAVAAEKSGKVMSEKSVAAAEKFEQNLKKLDDQIKGLTVTGGNILIPMLNTAGEALQTEAKIAALVAIEFQRMTGQIDYNEAAQRAAAVAAGDLGAALEEQYVVVGDSADAHERAASTTQTLTAEQIALNDQTAALNSTWQGYSPTVSDAAVANAEFQATIGPLTGAVSDLNFGMGELNTSTIFHEAIQNLDADAALALGVSLGMVDEKTLAVKDALDAARVKYDENRDGLISAAEAANGYSDAVLMLTGNLQAAVAANQQLNALANGAGATAGGGVVSGGGGGYASGVQNMVVPPGYPNDTYPMRVQSGEVVDVWTSQQERNRAMGGGGDNITNIFNDHRATAMYLADQRRKKRARADALMGM